MLKHKFLYSVLAVLALLCLFYGWELRNLKNGPQTVIVTEQKLRNYDKQGQSRVLLQELTPRNFEIACSFGPYTNSQEISEAIVAARGDVSLTRILEEIEFSKYRQTIQEYGAVLVFLERESAEFVVENFHARSRRNFSWEYPKEELLKITGCTDLSKIEIHINTSGQRLQFSLQKTGVN